MTWQLIKTAPKDGRPLRFKTDSGEEFDGTFAPYWCGSDCPCDIEGEGVAPCDEPPECWCAYRAGSNLGEESDPVAWSIPHPVNDSEEEK